MIPLYTLNMIERTLHSIQTAKTCGRMTVREHAVLERLEQALREAQEVCQ